MVPYGWVSAEAGHARSGNVRYHGADSTRPENSWQSLSVSVSVVPPGAHARDADAQGLCRPLRVKWHHERAVASRPPMRNGLAFPRVEARLLHRPEFLRAARRQIDVAGPRARRVRQVKALLVRGQHVHAEIAPALRKQRRIHDRGPRAARSILLPVRARHGRDDAADRDDDLRIHGAAAGIADAARQQTRYTRAGRVHREPQVRVVHERLPWPLGHVQFIDVPADQVGATGRRGTPSRPRRRRARPCGRPRRCASAPGRTPRRWPPGGRLRSGSS